jgi:hydrogenase expression/formation protein HypE
MMEAGKLDATNLENKVFPFTGKKRAEVVLRAAIGEDSAAIELDDWCCVFSSDPITGAITENGWLAVHVACNDVVANGAEPVGVMITVLMPEKTSAEDVEKVMKSAHEAALELGIEIMGGHTEFTYGLDQPVICTTAIGKVKKDKLITSAGAKPGDDIVITKAVGLEGTAILALDYEEQLKGLVAEKYLAKAKTFLQLISVVPEGRIASALGATAMHDITEGGLLGALYEIAEASGVGIEVDAKSIPIWPETKTIAEALKIDPFKLISSGSMLITVPEGDKLVAKLKEAGINGAVIGKVTSGRQKKLIATEKVVEITKPEGDELWRAKKMLDK